MTDVARWLAGLGLEQYADAFAENDIDIDVVTELTDHDLKSIGISLGHRRKILRGIKELSLALQPLAREAPSNGQDPPAKLIEQGERRHLTVLFADMAGSTRLSSELDPEDYRSVIRAYQKACTEAIRRYDGFLAQYLGDGVLAYFGYPRAHEDDAERAVRAGKEVITAVSKLSPRSGLRLQSRVGVATGDVVVGETIGEGTNQVTTIAGETPNLAARLQALAPPDTLIISDGTRRLLEGRFSFDALGPQNLKGFNDRVEAFAVGETTADHARYEAKSRQGPPQLIGREEEVGLLLRRWALVEEGDGQVVLLSAEAGVGKSRVLHALQERLKRQPYNRVLYFSSPFHQNSALYPAADHLRRELQLGKHENEQTIFDRLQRNLQKLGTREMDYARYLSPLLGVNIPERFDTPEPGPEEFRARTLDAIITIIERMSQQVPVLMVIEDAQWVDPTTLELLTALINRLRDKRILLIIAYRPEFAPPWGREGHVTTCTLKHLSRKESAQLVCQITGGKTLPGDIIDQIVSRTDGVPLFIEELTKSVLESGLLRDAGDGFELQGTSSSFVIPNSLQDSLMARLDRLPSAKEIAQIGAVIGREFSYELLSQATEQEAQYIDAALEDLVESGLLFRHGNYPNAVFEFKHALIRDVSYESLLKSNRRRIHGRIANALEKKISGQALNALELVAHHFEGAGNAEKATAYWHMAGQRASEHSAYHEAIAHCERALNLLESLPDPELRCDKELDMQLIIGVSSIAVRGFSSPAVLKAYSRARDLARELQDRAKLFAATWGVWMYQQQAGRIDSARRMADELLDLSELLGDTEFRLEAHHAAWATCYRMGDFKGCRYHADQGIALHDPGKHFELCNRYAGHDAGICARNHAALSSWFLGYPDQAIDHDRASVELAEQISHPVSKVHAKCFGSILYRHLGDPVTAQRYTEDALQLSRKFQYPQFTGYAEVIQGWAIAQIDNRMEGIAIMEKAIDDLTRIGAWARCATFLPCLVATYAKYGENEKALASAERTVELIQRSGERTAETEILVLKGEILERNGAPRADTESALYAALELARKDSAKAMELRAATALARLWQNHGEHQEALQILTPVYTSITEGLETPDVKAAALLIDELRENTR